MLYIAHRGLLNGPSQWENAPWAIEEAIQVCGNVEVDLWEVDGEFYLGHDKPNYKVNYMWLRDCADYLWIHCKNIQVLETLSEFPSMWHFFWHQEDTVTLTSKGFVWAYPGKQPIRNSIAVLPEWYDDDFSSCLGICTDYVLRYRGDL
jgi:hypothetical protein